MGWEYVLIGDTTKKVLADVVDTDKYVQGIKLVDPTDGEETPLVVLQGSQPTLPIAIIDADGDALTMAKPSVISSTPTISTSIYAAGDALSTDPLSFANAAQTTGGTGHVLKLAIYDDDDEAAAMDVWLFKSTFTQTANSPFSLTDDQLDECVGVIHVTAEDYEDAVNGQVAFRYLSPPLPYNVDATTLYAHVVVQGTPTYAGTTDLEFRLHTVQD